MCGYSIAGGALAATGALAKLVHEGRPKPAKSAMQAYTGFISNPRHVQIDSNGISFE
jgi:hypothetical protein